MNVGSSNGNFDLKKIKDTLTEIKHEGKLQGVLFSTREGTLISKVLDHDFDNGIFTAMTASVIDSAEDLMNTISENRVNKIITEVDDISLIILGCRKKAFLVLIIGNDSKVEKLLDNIDIYIQKLMETF